MKIKRIDYKDIRPGADIIPDRSQGSFPKEEAAVEEIFTTVKKRGDKALLSYTERFDGAKLTAAAMVVSAKEIDAAKKAVPLKLQKAMDEAAENIRTYHAKQLQTSWFDTDERGIMLGQKVTPLQRVGVYVPGGKASYPSTVLMDVIPAVVAGCEEIYMVTPPDKKGRIAPELLYAASIAGVTKIFKVGGAQAVAALALGTKTIPKVDKIVGPGNIYVALAKKRVFGMVGIDSVAGPSEICVLADESANPKFVVADMFSQAEHDELASAVLITDSVKLADAVEKEIQKAIKEAKRAEIIGKSIENYGMIITAKNMDKAIEAVNRLAPEHLEVMTKAPMELLPKIRNAGAIFLGHYSCEPLGDYFAGPNHVLPTNGTARFFSPLGVDDFIKKSSIISYDRSAFLEASKSVMAMAKSEGLYAHANSVKVRVDNEGK